MPHPAIAPGRVAVITGGASGIGLAAARKFASAGMKIVLADLKGAALTRPPRRSPPPPRAARPTCARCRPTSA